MSERVVSRDSSRILPGESDQLSHPYLTILSQMSVFERGAAEQVEPWVWLTDVLERIISGRIKAHELERLLPWTWKAERLAAAVNA
jgi:hypothetical protein